MAKYLGILSGKGGVGKSLGYSEYVSLSNGSVVQIGPFIDNLMGKNEEKIKFLIAKTNNGSDELFEILEPPKELVLDIFHFNQENQSLCSEKRNPLWLMRKPAPESLIKVSYESGEIKVTREHKFIVMRSGRFVKVKAEDIKPGEDYVLIFAPEKNDNLEDRSAFIRAIFDSKGSVSKNRFELKCESKSKELIYQTSSLIRTGFGICSKIRNKISNDDKETYWSIIISGSDILRYAENIGFNDPEKKNKLLSLIKQEKLVPNKKVYPIGSLIKKIRINKNIAVHKISEILECSEQLINDYENELYPLSEDMVLKLIHAFEKLNVSGEDIYFLRSLIQSDYRFECIKEITEEKYDKPYVYDFQVCEEGGHFVHSTGIIISNTTTAINLGSALNYFDKDVTIVDGNLSTPNIGIHLGVPVVPINLHHALRGENHINEAVYLHPAGMKIVPAGISIQDLKTTNPDLLGKTIKPLNRNTEYIIIDGAAGLGREAFATIRASDQIIIVTNPEMPAITDALKTLKLCEELGKPVIGVVLTRTRPNNLDVSLKNIETILEKPVIGIIPEDRRVRLALIRKDAVVYTYPKTKASIGYKRLAANMLGINFEPEIKTESWILKVLKRLGL